MVLVDSSAWIEALRRNGDLRVKLAIEGLLDAYEAQWNGAAKTLVSPEWSCVIEDRDEEDMLIKVIRKEDLREAIKELVEHPGPFLLDVVVPYAEHVMPFIPAGKSAREILIESPKTQG